MKRTTLALSLTAVVVIAACSAGADPTSGGTTNGNGNNNGNNTTSGSDSGSSSNNNNNTNNTTDGSTSNNNTVDGSSNNGTDSGPPHCGDPGDTGNDFGVGKYCASITHCLGNNKATLCATLGGDPSQTFCTTMCKDQDAGAAECGMNATCECQGGQCGCYPNKCLNQ